MTRRLDRLNVTLAAADYSAAIRAELTDNQLLNVRRGDAVPADYVVTGELLARCVGLQRPGFESLTDYADELIAAEARAHAGDYHLSRVLVGCEYSATVRNAFSERGHYAVSCDVLPSNDPSGLHHTGDVRDVITGNWHIAVLHPPCTYIAACQLWRCLPKHDVRAKTGHHDGWRAEQKAAGAAFVRELGEDSRHIPGVCVENPKSCIGSEGLLPGFTPDVVQPHEFGHDASKETWLWLRGLAALERDPAAYVAPRWVTNNNGNRVPRWANQCDGSGADRRGPSADRGHKRSAFWPGIAAAMAEQWGGVSLGALA